MRIPQPPPIVGQQFFRDPEAIVDTVLHEQVLRKDAAGFVGHQGVGRRGQRDRVAQVGIGLRESGQARVPVTTQRQHCLLYTSRCV